MIAKSGNRSSVKITSVKIMRKTSRMANVGGKTPFSGF